MNSFFRMRNVNETRKHKRYYEYFKCFNFNTEDKKLVHKSQDNITGLVIIKHKKRI